jgi:homoserine acetyltransferase
MVLELHTLLKNAEVSDSYVMVGASFGGLNARIFASQYPMAYAVSFRTEAYTAGAKIEGFQCLDQVRATRRSDGQAPLGDKPLVVLTHGKRGELGAKDSDERAWVEMQEELARLSSNSKHIFVEKSGHQIVLDQPEAVVEAIQQVVENARRRKH